MPRLAPATKEDALSMLDGIAAAEIGMNLRVVADRPDAERPVAATGVTADERHAGMARGEFGEFHRR